MRAFAIFLSVCFTLRDYISTHFVFVDCLLLSSRIFVRIGTTFFCHIFIYFVPLALLYRVLSDFWYSSTRMQVFLLFLVWKNRINSHIKSKSVLAYECYY